MSEEPTSASQVAELRQRIDQHLRTGHVYEHIRSFITEYLGQSQPEEGLRDKLIDALRERGVVDSVLRTLERPQDDAAPARGAVDVELLPHQRYIHLQVLEGKAFVSHLTEDCPPGSVYVLYVHFRHQRFRSRPVPCAVEPAFDESFLLELAAAGGTQAASPPAPDTLLQWESPIALSLVRLTPRAHHVPGHATVAQAVGATTRDCSGQFDAELVGTQSVEWRSILSTGAALVSAELLGVGEESRRAPPVGVLSVRLDLLPAPPAAGVLAGDDITRRISAERARDAEAQRQFYRYAKLWWREFVEIDPSFRSRLVKIFVENERGEHVAACSSLVPLRAGRLLDSPHHAARFVSLLPWQRREVVGGGREEVWPDLHTFLSAGAADVECHAVLLCSLLLGFGLDAYVCVGCLAVEGEGAGVRGGPLDVIGGPTSRDHVWVMTRSTEGNVTFWEPLTGQRHPLGALCPYERIGCVFNHRRFLANVQGSEAVADCDFALEDGALWKAMDENLLAVLPHQRPVPLCPPTVPAIAAAEAIEAVLRSFVEGYRGEQFAMSTRWDEELCYLLTPALVAYETERVTGHSYGSAEFQQSIKRAVPVGASFKGFPIMFNHCDPDRMAAALTAAEVADAILRIRGDAVTFALRVCVFPYPEATCAVWLMLAARFRATAANADRV